MQNLDWWHTAIVTAPAAEPVSKDDMKDHLPLDGTDHDDLLDIYIAAARIKAEGWQKRQLITATWKLFMSAFPSEIWLPFPPLQSVTHVKYYDTGGNQQTLTVDTDYQVDANSEPGRIRPAYNTSWPDTRIGNFNAIEVQYVAGYGNAATDVPESTRQAVQQMVADMFRIRETHVTGAVAEVSESAGSLLDMETAEWFG